MAGRIEMMHCPKCKKEISASTCVEEGADMNQKPIAGDYSVCAYCATLLMFDSVNPNTCHMLSKEEIANLPPDMSHTLRNAQWAVRYIQHEPK